MVETGTLLPLLLQMWKNDDGIRLAFPQKLTSYVTQYFHTERELKTCPQRNLYMNVCSSIHGSQKVEATQKPLNWWMDKEM